MIHFFQDMAEIMGENMTSAGYGNYLCPAISWGSFPCRTFRMFWNIHFRSIESRKRDVLKADYIVPIEHAYIEKSILEKAEKGQNLRPHMSLNIADPYFDDDMLSEFGIHHFHLSEKVHHRNNKFFSRTSDLLFAYVTDDRFYSLGIFNHKSWCSTEIIERLNKAWPEILHPYKSSFSKLSWNATEETRKATRIAHANTAITLSDGSIIMPPGGGMTVSGISSRVADNIESTKKFLRSIPQNCLNSNYKLIKIDDLLIIKNSSGQPILECKNFVPDLSK